jgi:hypothetical protein
MSFRAIRITVLLLVLALVGGVTYWEGVLVRSWLRPLDIVIHPINGDGSDASAAYIAQLSETRFQEIGNFFDAQAERFRLKKLPAVHIRLGREITQLPPPPPEGARSALASIVWSLKTRYYAFRHTSFWSSFGRIRLFVVYHEGEEGKPLQHSLGLRKGLIGVVHVFAKDDMAAKNNVVIAHELFHTLGASDKYDAEGNPVYPDGFADPGDAPRYPQHAAELMAGRRAVSPDRAEIPESLERCVVGAKTAYEINW